jgi:hypothetical protein
MCVTLELPVALESLNRLHGRHWSAKHRERQRWGWLLRAALLALQGGQGEALAALRSHVAAKGRVAVKVTTWRRRRIDQTNLEGGFKELEDCLKAEGLIVDDGPKWIDREISQALGTPRTVIELQALAVHPHGEL